MLERAAPRVEQKSAPAAIGKSPDQIAALRVAALLMLANAVLAILVAIAFRTQRIPIVQIVLSLFLSYYLYTLRPHAEALALGLAVLAAIVLPIPAGALTLLLSGESSFARRATGVMVFCVFNVGFYVLLMLLRLSRRSIL